MSRTLPLLALVFAAPAVAAPTATIDQGKIVVTGVRSPDGLSVVVAEGFEAEIAARPAVAGAWVADADTVTFTPKYPLTPGVKYRVLGTSRRLEVQVPKPARGTPTRVNVVRPTAAELPENILRFYIEFDGPMPRGDVYRYVQILTVAGKPVTQPFLQLDEELWNADQTRLTLLIDPGRIKREVKPQIDLGPVFQQGQKYTLLVSGKWPTLDGGTLGDDVRKPIAAAAPVREGIDPKQWKLSTPDGESDTLKVAFDRALDHALLVRALSIVGPDGKPVAGKAEPADDDRGWTFRPAGRWAAGTYALRVDSVLEDVCGNRIGQPFETDVLHPAPKKGRVPHLDLPFTVRR